MSRYITHFIVHTHFCFTLLCPLIAEHWIFFNFSAYKIIDRGWMRQKKLACQHYKSKIYSRHWSRVVHSILVFCSILSTWWGITSYEYLWFVASTSLVMNCLPKVKKELVLHTFQHDLMDIFLPHFYLYTVTLHHWIPTPNCYISLHSLAVVKLATLLPFNPLE